MFRKKQKRCGRCGKWLGKKATYTIVEDKICGLIVICRKFYCWPGCIGPGR